MVNHECITESACVENKTVTKASTMQQLQKETKEQDCVIKNLQGQLEIVRAEVLAYGYSTLPPKKDKKQATQDITMRRPQRKLTAQQTLHLQQRNLTLNNEVNKKALYIQNLEKHLRNTREQNTSPKDQSQESITVSPEDPKEIKSSRQDIAILKYTIEPLNEMINFLTNKLTEEKEQVEWLKKELKKHREDPIIKKPFPRTSSTSPTAKQINSSQNLRK